MSKIKICPACNDAILKYPMVSHNAYSRYADCYICSICGMREAMTGFFWKENAIKKNVKLIERRQTGE
jgi:uncharacterized protein with PIN domain